MLDSSSLSSGQHTNWTQLSEIVPTSAEILLSALINCRAKKSFSIKDDKQKGGAEHRSTYARTQMSWMKLFVSKENRKKNLFVFLAFSFASYCTFGKRREELAEWSTNNNDTLVVQNKGLCEPKVLTLQLPLPRLPKNKQKHLYISLDPVPARTFPRWTKMYIPAHDPLLRRANFMFWWFCWKKSYFHHQTKDVVDTRFMSFFKLPSEATLMYMYLVTVKQTQMDKHWS